eukprot:s3333_g4.t1
MMGRNLVPLRLVDSISYNAVLASEEQQWQWALTTFGDTWLKQMGGAAPALAKAGAMLADRMAADTIGYNALTSSCARSSSWGQAFHVLEQMVFVQLQVDVVSFATKAEACVKASWILAVDALNGLQVVKIEPNQMVLTSVISALCDLKGAWTSALQTLTLSPLPASEIDTSFLNVVMRSCSTSRHWRSVVALLPRAQRAQGPAGRQSFSTAMEALPSWGWEQSLKLFEEMLSQ